MASTVLTVLLHPVLAMDSKVDPLNVFELSESKKVSSNDPHSKLKQNFHHTCL